MIVVERGKSSAIFGLSASYQPQVAFEIAAATSTGRHAFDLVPLPIHGPVCWLASMPYLKSEIWDWMAYWRQQKELPTGTHFPIRPLYLAPNDDPVTIIENQAPDDLALIVRDWCPSGLEYDASSPREITHWLHHTAPALAKRFNAAIVTTISVPYRVGAQDLADHCDILVGVEIEHSIGLKLHQLKPATSREWLELQVHAGRDGTHAGGAGCVLAGFRHNELVRGDGGQPEILSRRSAA